MSQRCSLCGVNYPPDRSECIRCGGPLQHCPSPVSEDWANVDVTAAGTEGMRVEMWRLRVLIEAGYPFSDAEQLAAAAHVDLHQAAELATRCKPELAARILL